MSFLSDLIFGVREIRTAANIPAPLRKALRIVGATVTDDPATGATVITITGEGAAAAVRQIIAGAGLTGGGDLTADRTLAIKLRDPDTSGPVHIYSGLGLWPSGLGVRTSEYGGLISGVFGGSEGLGLKLPAASGLGIGFGGAFVRVPSTNPSLVLTADGVDVKRGTTIGALAATTTGLDVDATKVAVLSGGKITAGNSRGKTLVNSNYFSSTTQQGVTGATTAWVSLGSLSLASIAIGDEIQLTGTAIANPAQQQVLRMTITSSATLDAGTTYDTWTIPVGFSASSIQSHPIIRRLFASTAGDHYVHLSSRKTASGNTDFYWFERSLLGNVFRT